MRHARGRVYCGWLECTTKVNCAWYSKEGWSERKAAAEDEYNSAAEGETLLVQFPVCSRFGDRLNFPVKQPAAEGRKDAEYLQQHMMRSC